MLSEPAMRARVVLSFLLAASLFAGQGQAQAPATPAPPAAEAAPSPPAASAPANTGELKKAQDAQDRARDMRASGDARHAQLLEKLAQIWTEAARELLAAIEAETKAQVAQKKALELREQIENERSLLEENIARRSRAQVELKKVQEEVAARPPAPPPKEKGKKGKGGKKGGKK